MCLPHTLGLTINPVLPCLTRVNEQCVVSDCPVQLLQCHGPTPTPLLLLLLTIDTATVFAITITSAELFNVFLRTNTEFSCLLRIKVKCTEKNSLTLFAF